MLCRLTPQRRRAKNGMCKLKALNPETNISQLHGELLNGKLAAVSGACCIVFPAPEVHGVSLQNQPQRSYGDEPENMLLR